MLFYGKIEPKTAYFFFSIRIKKDEKDDRSVEPVIKINCIFVKLHI